MCLRQGGYLFQNFLEDGCQNERKCVAGRIATSLGSEESKSGGSAVHLYRCPFILALHPRFSNIMEPLICTCKKTAELVMSDEIRLG